MEAYFEPLRRHFRILVVSPARGEFATIFEDISAAKEMEAALTASNEALKARNEELDAYAHTVAHDLKNPVAAILGFAEHLGEGLDSMPESERRESLEAITRSAQKMQAIIDALLLLGEARRSDVPISAARPGPHHGRMPERPRARGETSRGRGPPPAKLAVGSGLRAVGRAGPHELRQQRAEVRRPAPASRARGGGRETKGHVRFWVRDNGRGLTPEEIGRTFAPFTRLSVEDVTGHGLGLSIVRRLVERMGGEVAVESEGRPGAGCTFSFTLPRGSPSARDRRPGPLGLRGSGRLRGTGSPTGEHGEAGGRDEGRESRAGERTGSRNQRPRAVSRQAGSDPGEERVGGTTARGLQRVQRRKRARRPPGHPELAYPTPACDGGRGVAARSSEVREEIERAARGGEPGHEGVPSSAVGRAEAQGP